MREEPLLLFLHILNSFARLHALDSTDWKVKPAFPGVGSRPLLLLG